MAFNYNFQLDYIFFFYGLSFLILAAVCFSLKQDIIKLPFIWLGLFGLSHGLNEWLDLLAITFSDCNLFFAIRTCVMALSFIFLFEFARRLRYYLFKRTYGLWVYIFLLGMAFSGLLYGLKSINVTMRYFLAIPAGFLSSWALYKESSNSLKKTPILVVSVSLALYGIASGFIVPKSDMVPSCWINHDSFSGAFGFPVQLLRGFLAACMAFSIWIYSKRLSKTKHTDMRGYFIIAFILLFIISVGWIFVNYISNYSQGQVSKKADIETRVLSDRLNQEISKVNQFVSTMSGSPWIWPALAYNNIEDIDKANEVLDRYNGNLKMSVSYLIDKNGMTVASSNRDAKDSFIGELYYIRPYFQDALSGKPGSYMGVGLTSKQRGYYSSMPVKNPQGEILGVVAIKKNAKILEEYFKVYSHAFLVNKSGVIFLSSDASLVFNTLWPVDKNVLDELIGSKQFSEIFPCKPVFSKELLNDTIVSYNKNNFYALRRSISLPGWDIIFLSSMKPVLYYRFFGILIIALICIIIIIFFFIFEKEKALNDSNMQLLYMLKEQRFIFDHAKDFVYRHDTKGIFIYVSKAVERILGYTQEEFQNHYTTYLTENPLNKKAAEYTENALRTGESSSSYELEIYHKNGSRIILEVSEEVYFEKGQIAGIIGIARDVTEKKKAQDMIANSAREWALTFDSMADGVSIHDPDFEIINVNRTLCDLLGKKKEELIGQKCYQIFHREDQPVSACPLEKSKYTKQREYVEIFEKTLNKWLAISVSPILDKNGDIVNIIHLIRDITERKRLEKTKDEFVSTVSHELRTPLTAIKEGIAIVLEGLAGPVNEEQKDFLDTAKKNVDRLSRLINDVLDYQKLQAGRIEFEMKPGDINAVMRDAKQIMEPLVKNKGLVLNLNLAGDLPVVSFDRDKIMQVVINLVNNAIKFTQKGSITVATSKKYDNAICVSVIDTGAGIKEEDLDKLFQSFSQVGDGKKNMAGGTGLGLAISKVIIQNHGGKIWVESEYGKGSAFYFVFPVVERRRPNYGS